jgi:transposase-like protein
MAATAGLRPRKSTTARRRRHVRGVSLCAALLRAKRDVAAAKAFFRRAFSAQGRLPDRITLDGYQASDCSTYKVGTTTVQASVRKQC